MALTPEVRNSQYFVTSILGGAATGVEVSQYQLTAVANLPTEFAQASQFLVTSVLGGAATQVEVSQLFVTVIAAGRVDDASLRAWTYSMDGHDFYVLRLGDSNTLVYDVYSEQWMQWTSPGLGFWRPRTGLNWIGGQVFSQNYGSDVIVGDDAFGVIYFLDPEQAFDEPPDSDADDQQLYFQRITMGQVTMTGRNVMPCYAVWLTTDMGQPAYDGAGVTLEISDDAGQTFEDMGTVNVTIDDFRPELSWYSLGQIEAPGRLFKITDDGAVARIDTFEMNDPDDANGG